MTSGPIPPMTVPGMVPPAPPQKTSAAAVTSMIMGILFCLAFTSLLAIVLSIVGFSATKDNKKKGRGFAITGLVLGIVGLIFWGIVGAGVAMMLSISAEPRMVARNFAREAAAGNYPAALAMCDTGVTQADVESLNNDMNSAGKKYTDLTTYASSVRMVAGTTSCDLVGVADFSGNAKAFETALRKDPAGGWKIVWFRLK